MDLYFNNQKITKIELSPESSVANFKKRISDWLVPQGHSKYSIRMLLNNNVELSPEIFKSNLYDNVSFIDYKNLLNGGSTYIISTPNIQKKETPRKDENVMKQETPRKDENSCQGKMVYVLYKLRSAEARVFETLRGAITFWATETQLEDVEELDTMYMPPGVSLEQNRMGGYDEELQDVEDILYRILDRGEYTLSNTVVMK